MKRIFPVLLMVSIILNCFWGYALHQKPEKKDEGGSLQAKAVPKLSGISKNEISVKEQAVKPVWPEISKQDYPKMVDALRKLGFPDRTIRVVVVDLIKAKFEAARIRLITSGATRNVDPHGFRSAEDERQFKLLDVAQGKEIQDALGFGFAETEMAALERKRTYGDIPREKVQQCGDIYRQYYEMKLSSKMSPKELAFLDASRAEDIKGVLNEQEWVEWQLHQTTAGQLTRRYLAGVDVSKDERVAVYDAVNKHWQSPDFVKFGAKDENSALGLHADLTKILGPDRYYTYLMNEGGEFAHMNAAIFADSPVPASKRLAMNSLILESQKEILKIVKENPDPVALAEKKRQYASGLETRIKLEYDTRTWESFSKWPGSRVFFQTPTRTR